MKSIYSMLARCFASDQVGFGIIMNSRYRTNYVVNTFLGRGYAEAQPICPMKLQKLLYFFHGWHLSLTGGEPGISDNIETWPYGPVIPLVYHEFKMYGSSDITSYAEDVDVKCQRLGHFKISHKEVAFHNIFDRVWKKYIPYTGLQLSSMSHMPGAPWEKMYKAEQRIIPDSLIKEYFDELLKTEKI